MGDQRFPFFDVAIFLLLILCSDISMDLIEHLRLIWVNVLNWLEHEGVGTNFKAIVPQLFDRALSLEVFFIERMFRKREYYFVEGLDELLHLIYILVE